MKRETSQQVGSAVHILISRLQSGAARSTAHPARDPAGHKRHRDLVKIEFRGCEGNHALHRIHDPIGRSRSHEAVARRRSENCEEHPLAPMALRRVRRREAFYLNRGAWLFDLGDELRLFQDRGNSSCSHVDPRIAEFSFDKPISGHEWHPVLTTRAENGSTAGRADAHGFVMLEATLWLAKAAVQSKQPACRDQDRDPDKRQLRLNPQTTRTP